MAFNWPTFRTRALTAIVFAVIMLTGLLWNDWSYFLLFSAIQFGCWWEYLNLTEKIHPDKFSINVRLGFMIIGYGLMLRLSSPTLEIAGYSLRDNFSLPVSLAGFVLLITGIFQQNKINWNAFANAAAGWMYISLSWALFVNMYDAGKNYNHHVYAIYFPLILIGCMWINDTMAYIVGSLIGKTPLSKISPKKTWEGTIGGGILASLIMGYVGFSYDFHQHSLAWWIGFAVVAVILGTSGDLLESKLKRMAGVKDSGTLMPGHGGFLDRFDSLLLAIPFAWVYILLPIS